jgi:hypothetical protein
MNARTFATIDADIHHIATAVSYNAAMGGFSGALFF